MKEIFLKRKKIRLSDYDYSQENMYFITIKIKYSIWQKSFYEHIIRNRQEYLKIKEYIKNNVLNWSKDKYF